MLDLACPLWPARPALALLLVLSTAGWGCRRDAEPASPDGTGPTTAAESPQPQAAGENTLVVQPIPIPEGTPAELFDFIDNLDQQLDLTEAVVAENQGSELSADARQAVGLRRVMEARIGACDKILARQVPEETRLRAITIQLDALRTLVALDPESMTERFDRYTQRIAAGSDPLLARMAQATRFQADVNRTISGSGPNNEELIAQLQDLLAQPEAGPETLNATREAAGWILQYGDLSTAAQSFRLIGKTFQKHPDELLASEGKSLVSQSIHLELTRLAQGVAQQQPEALPQLLAKVDELLAPENDDPDILAYAMQTAQLLEFAGHPREALQAYQAIGRRYQDAPDAGLAADVKRTVELANRRLNLIGQSLQLVGVKLDGNQFDWQDYRGKWVVVCFWTTWHQEWLAEVDNLRKAIAPYTDPAVEVVAISLDDDRNRLERFLQEHPTYWPVLVDPDPTAAGFENPNAVRCGVEAVPFIFLVNPQGEVVDIHLMGDRLTAALAAQINKS